MSESNGVKRIKGMPKKMFIRTPLLHSAPLSNLASQCGKKIDVYLKMEALQPSGSFKVRGLSNSILKAYDSSKGPFHIISSSGGNAGLAAAYCARQMDERCTIFVPSTCEEFVKDSLRAEGANVIVAGSAWDECDIAAKRLLEKEKSAGRMAYYVHPFEGEDTVDGHSTMMDEVVEQLKEVGIPNGRPNLVTCSAGGCGLLRGVMRGIYRAFSKIGLPELLVTQTSGANSFGSSILQARLKGQPWDSDDVVPVSLPAITSKATSLGAKTCSLQAVQEGLRYGPRLCTLVIEDGMAEDAAWRFAQDHRLLVELACSCVLAPIYHSERILSMFSFMEASEPIVMVVIVCGGNKINTEMIEQYRLKSEQQPDLKNGYATLNGMSI